MESKTEQPAFIYERNEKRDELPWKIWFELYDKDGEQIGAGVRPERYVHKSSADRLVKKLSQDDSARRYIVSKTNPFMEITDPVIEK